MIQAHILQVRNVKRQGTDAVQLELLPDAGAKQAFSFKPGQYVTIQGGPSDHPQWRCYSINTLPQADGGFSILVRRVANGLVSNWICDHIQVGDTLKALPPAGQFVLRDSQAPCLRMFAAGSGVGPIHALALHALSQGSKNIELFVANRNRATSMLVAELEQIARQHPDHFRVHSWYDDERGLPQPGDLFGELADVGPMHVYTCGPAPFMGVVLQSATEVGVAPEHFYTESFETDLEPDASADLADAGSSPLQVKMGGKVYHIDVVGQETLLAAMLKAGLPAPHACRVGECASCMCRLEKGDVLRLENEVLDEDDEKQGWVLACRTRACGEKVEIQFP